MTTVEIPPCATRLPRKSDKAKQTSPRIRTSLPHPEPPIDGKPPPVNAPMSPTKSAALNLLPNLLMSSVPSAPQNATGSPRAKKGDKVPLMSAKDPLSIPIMSVNFRRFVSKVGAVFWMQDRVEEIVMWRRGWKVTTTWMAAYAFLCYFPRLLFLLPQIIVIGITLATYKYTPAMSTASLLDPPAAPDTTSEGSVDWQGNIQAIQNLMGTFSDGYDAVHPFVLHLTHRTPYTPYIFTALVLSLIPGIILVSLPYLPIRAILLVGGLAPFVVTNPYIQYWITSMMNLLHSDTDLRWLRQKAGLDTKLPLTSFAQRFLDDNNLTDACWTAPKREVELFENERLVKLSSADAEVNESAWSKANLHSDERTAWTRRQDGWNDGSVSSTNLTFSLDPGWAFVETEDWRLDVDASWSPQGGDAHGWVYTNTSWLDPRPYFYKDAAVTRKRRWTRRIWYDAAKV
ncbi:integral peroxisomal membrane peroxin-domain-containing protein [Mucidula mucida]|nr:integral peroxisomal membrane peroxin-domain-containing protein [Mucidula mucida]